MVLSLFFTFGESDRPRDSTVDPDSSRLGGFRPAPNPLIGLYLRSGGADGPSAGINLRK